MEEDGADYAEVLALAQAEGYAEADPAMDVDGTDATQKLAILAHLAFGVWVPWGDIPRIGIEGIDSDLISYAGQLGYRIRLVAVARRTADGDGRLAMRVSPSLVRIGTPLAETRGAYNAVSLIGDAVGRMFFHGLGAGEMPTASAVVADIIDMVVGRSAITFRTTGVLDVDAAAGRVGGVETHERRFLRIMVADRPGVLSEITGLLGDHGISIASVIQQEAAGETEGVPLVIMTHPCGSAAVAAAIAAIDATSVVRGASTCLPVLEDVTPTRQ
jgi:homoserine dehydrogenase